MVVESFNAQQTVVVDVRMLAYALEGEWIDIHFHVAKKWIHEAITPSRRFMNRQRIGEAHLKLQSGRCVNSGMEAFGGSL